MPRSSFWLVSCGVFFSLSKGHNLSGETYCLGDGGVYHYYNFILSSLKAQNQRKKKSSIISDIQLPSHEAIFLPSYMGQQLVNIVYVIIQALCLQLRTDEI